MVTYFDCWFCKFLNYCSPIQFHTVIWVKWTPLLRHQSNIWLKPEFSLAVVTPVKYACDSKNQRIRQSCLQIWNSPQHRNLLTGLQYPHPGHFRRFIDEVIIWGQLIPIIFLDKVLNIFVIWTQAWGYVVFSILSVLPLANIRRNAQQVKAIILEFCKANTAEYEVPVSLLHHMYSNMITI